MEDELVTLQRFQDLTLAEPFIVLLNENNIEFSLESSPPNLLPYLKNNPLDNEYSIKVKKEDFEKASEVLKEQAERQIDNIEKDHYLFGFNDQELMEIVTKRDEWSEADYLLALKILKGRGKDINKEEENRIKEQRKQELAKPEPSQQSWIIVGYILAIFGGILGLCLGWYLSSFKKTLPDGTKVYAYNEQDRKHGKIILILSIISFSIFIVYEISRL
jgi:hypothetical protein